MTAPGIRATTVGGVLERPTPATRARLAARAIAADHAALLAMAVGLASGTWVAAVLLWRVDTLSAPPYDLAFFQQVIWNVGNTGQWVSGFNQGSFLGLHFSPALVVPALVERFVWHDVRTLNLFMAVALGAFVPAAFLFLRAALWPARISSPLAAGLTLGIPVWGAMQQVVRADFHPETFGVVLALLAGWAGLTRRIPAMWLLALAALATREDVAYAVGVVGLLVAARGRGTAHRHGLALAAVALLWGAFVFLVVMPWLRGELVSGTASYYAWLGGGLGALTAPFTKTALVVDALARPAPWFVVLGLLASTAGLPLLRPRWLLLVLPPLAASLLSSHWWQANLELQYPLILIVPLLVAAAMGGRRAIVLATHVARRRAAGHTRSTRRGCRTVAAPAALAVAVAVAMPGLAGAFVQPAMPPFSARPSFVGRSPGIERLEQVAASVPSDALLVADEGLMAPLAGRASILRLTAVSRPPAQGYVVIDRDAWSPTPQAARQHDRVAAALGSDARPLIADDGRFVVWGPVAGVAP